MRSALALNFGRVNAMSDAVLKAVTFFASYFLVLCFIASVIRSRAQLAYGDARVEFQQAKVAKKIVAELNAGHNPPRPEMLR